MMFPKQQRHHVSSKSRIIVLGDPHGDVSTAQAILDREMGAGGETVIACVGDAIGYKDGPTSSAMVDWLARHRVPTVSGNHEEWYFHQNQLSIVEDRRSDRKLTDDAANWIAQLPHRIDLCEQGSDEVLATIVHSLRTPHWDDVQPHSASRLMRELRGVKMVLIGHSHCPRLIKLDREGVASLEGFDFTKSDGREINIAGVPTVIVDAGSISRPRADLRQLDRGSGVGTYVVVDLERSVVTFRRIDRGTV